jgi:5-methylcytosine-specific restriction endonuclease McrBC GTP-binding regulatory subunit McrB
LLLEQFKWGNEMTDVASVPTFEMEWSGIKATAELRNKRFVVLAGSHARAEVVPSFEGHNYNVLRQKLLSAGHLIPDSQSEHLVFAQDVEFPAVSAAAAIILGRAANGQYEWHVPNDPTITYNDWEQQQRVVSNPAPKLEPVNATWVPFFHELAEKLLTLEDQQPVMIQCLQDAGVKVNDDEGEPLTVLDPFSFFSLILKHQSEPNVFRILTFLRERLELQAPVPTDLMGVPWSNPMNAWFFAYRSKRHPDDLATLWELAKQAMSGALDANTFERALAIRKVGLPKLTQGLFWLNPEHFLALTSLTNNFLERRGIRGSAKVETLNAMNQVLDAARLLAPNFVTLSHHAWFETQTDSFIAKLQDGRFPFQAFCDDVAKDSSDHVRAILMLDKKYAPLLIELLQDANLSALQASRSPFNGKDQLAVKISLAANTKTNEGAFGHALLFAEDSSYENVPIPAGLTLEVGLSEGLGDAARYALQNPETRERLLNALFSTLVSSAVFSTQTEFGIKPVPLTLERRSEVETQLDSYINAVEKNRRLRVGVTITPAQLESEAFTEHLEKAVNAMNDIKSILDELAQTIQPSSITITPVIQPTGTNFEAAPIGFTPIPGVPLNLILYGPPGTGKTYRVVDEALKVLDPTCLIQHPGREGRQQRKARYDQLVSEARVTFVTFHQSFGYEDFIEGIKPVMKSGQLSYELEDGLFLQAVLAAGGDLGGKPRAQSAPPANPDGQVWRMYIDGTAPVSQVRTRSLERNEIRMGSWGKIPSDLNALPEDRLESQQILFRDAVRVGDLMLLATGQDLIGALGVVTGEYRFDVSEPIFSSDFAHIRTVKWLATNLKLKASQVLGKTFAPPTLQRVVNVKPQQVLNAINPEGSPTFPVGLQSHVLIIDEINRGNVAKVFGELITLLEPSKRAGASEALSVRLPLSKRSLSIPQSLYVIGTMNTADRSLTLLDAALRRRFVFHPVWPEPEVLPVITIDGTALDLSQFLQAINARVERLLSREQVIGHAYLLDVPQSLEGVAQALGQRILPLLEEYFFEDWGQIRKVLADDQKPKGLQFIREVSNGGIKRFERDPSAFDDIEAFVRVYSGTNDINLDP